MCFYKTFRIYIKMVDHKYPFRYILILLCMYSYEFNDICFIQIYRWWLCCECISIFHTFCKTDLLNETAHFIMCTRISWNDFGETLHNVLSRLCQTDGMHFKKLLSTFYLHSIQIELILKSTRQPIWAK